MAHMNPCPRCKVQDHAYTHFHSARCKFPTQHCECDITYKYWCIKCNVEWTAVLKR